MSELTILYPIRKSPDWLVFACAVSLGAQNFDCERKERARRRQNRPSGFVETWRNVGPGEDNKFNVELFAPTEAELARIILDYEAAYPSRDFETHINRPERQWDGFRARGDRLRDRIVRYTNSHQQFAQAAE